jgi:DeoR family glycerol-3-phosphate regulon repressor
MANARRVFLVADHTKFGRSAITRIGHISDVSAIFTDSAPPPEFETLIQEFGITLHIAQEEPEETKPYFMT